LQIWELSNFKSYYYPPFFVKNIGRLFHHVAIIVHRIPKYSLKPFPHVFLLLFLYVVGCYSCYIACVLVKYYLHNHHLISGALVVYCVAIDLPPPGTHHHHPPICCWCCCYSIALLMLILFCFMCHGTTLKPTPCVGCGTLLQLKTKKKKKIYFF
jgi:hypothetical protein